MFVIKKYFSLFTPTLITCLAVGSAPSRAMENLTEECWAKKGDIILLAGTSSSGKTTTTQQLKINCPNFEINGRDEIMSQVPQYGGYNKEEETPEQYDLKRQEYFLEHLAQWAIEHQKHPLILDVLAPQPMIDALEKANYSSHPFRVLLYVPLSEYRERLHTRNRQAFEEKKGEELRNPLDMAFQYEEIFKVSTQDVNPPLGMKINEKEMQEILSDFSQDTIEFLKEASKKGLSEDMENEKELEEEHRSDSQKMLDKMFSSVKEGYLVPKDDYNLVIDTSVSSPSEIAKTILTSKKNFTVKYK